MSKIKMTIVGASSLALTVFMALFGTGLYTALDAASSYSLGVSTESSLTEEKLATPEENAQQTALTDEVDEADALEALISKPDPDTSDESVLAATSTYEAAATRTASQAQASAPAQSSQTPSVQSSSLTPSVPSPAPTPSQSTPTPSVPEKTYYPAWDEWVSEGHWEEVTRAATYGERAVYGSVCNECGANVSGQAASHLKATRHSGYHEGVVGYESYQITPARTESVWVDTSHWVHHPAYYA